MAAKPILTAFVTLFLAAGPLVGPAIGASEGEAVGMTAATVVSVDCASFAADPAAARSVTAAPGASVVLSLCSNPTTGYRWSEPVSSDTAVASVGGWEYVAPPSDLIGASGAENVTIAANAPGTAVIAASYGQPWEGGDAGAWTIDLTIEVRQSSAIVIGCDEFAATPAVSQSVDLAVGESLTVSLCSNPTTGFRGAMPSPATRLSSRSAAGSTSSRRRTPGSWGPPDGAPDHRCSGCRERHHHGIVRPALGRG